MGLTGLITWAQLRLSKINSALLEVEDIPFSSLDSFWSLSEESDREFEYTVAWLDCYSYDRGRLRGIFSRARHVDKIDGTLAHKWPRPRLAVPCAMPGWVLNPAAVRLFNRVYHAAKHGRGMRQVRMESFLFPLDAIRNWNRLYGRMGFMQLQCAFTAEASLQGAAELLQAISASGQGSFLSVLKRFGGLRSPGLLSFPQPGITFALDFPSRGPSTRALLERCQDIVLRYGGRIYPAKDSCMTPASFNAGYPAWRELMPYIDPGFSSSFWRRTAGALAA